MSAFIANSSTTANDGPTGQNGTLTFNAITPGSAWDANGHSAGNYTWTDQGSVSADGCTINANWKDSLNQYGTVMYTYQAGPPPQTLQITTLSLPSGQVGVLYDSGLLTATGGTPFPSSTFPDPYTWNATNIPTGLYVSYFTGELSGLPAVDGSFFPTVTVHDFDGATYSKAFSVAIQPAQQQGRFTKQQKAYYALIAEFWLQKSDYWEQAYLDCKQITAGEPKGDPTAASCDMDAVLSTLTSAIGLYYNSKAADPADPDYATIAEPTPPILTLPSTNPSWTTAEITAYNAWKALILTEEQLVGLEQAQITTVNRAEGAYQAGDSYWEQQQVVALSQYSYLEAFCLQDLLRESTQLQTAYAQSGFPNFAVSVDQATQFELGVAENGLPSDMQQALTTMGIDSQGIEFLQKALSSFDPNTTSGNIAQSFVPSAAVASTIQQLASSFITNGIPVLSSPPSSTTCNGVFNGTFNGDIAVSSGQICTFIAGGITGNVHVTGGTLVLNNAFVEGDVQANGGGVITVGPSASIQGNLQVLNIPTGFGLDVVYGANVNGDLQIQNSASIAEIGLPAPFPANVIGGNLQIQGNTASIVASGNDVSGNLQDQSNTGTSEIWNNLVGKNLLVQSNTGSTDVTNNTVSRNLICSDDSSLTGSQNTATSKQGQCSSY